MSLVIIGIFLVTAIVWYVRDLRQRNQIKLLCAFLDECLAKVKELGGDSAIHELRNRLPAVKEKVINSTGRL